MLNESSVGCNRQRLMLDWARADWRPPSDLPAWRWCEENVELDNSGPMPGRRCLAGFSRRHRTAGSGA